MKSQANFERTIGRALPTVVVVILCSALGLAGIDLVLPAVPSLTHALPGSAAAAQMVIASYVTGAALGLIVLGEAVDMRSADRIRRP